MVGRLGSNLIIMKIRRKREGSSIRILVFEACTWKKATRVLIGGMGKKRYGGFGSHTHSLMEVDVQGKGKNTLKEEKIL